MRIDKKKLKCAVVMADISYGELCERTGFSRTFIYNIQEGKSCNEETAKKIANALNTTVEQISE